MSQTTFVEKIKTHILYWARELSRYSDWLRAGRSGDRIPVGARSFAHVQTGPEAHSASCTVGTGSFPGVKRPGRGADHPPTSSAEVENEYSYTSTPPLGTWWPFYVSSLSGGRIYSFHQLGCRHKHMKTYHTKLHLKLSS
jgi:hypothetical protein